MVDPVNFTNYDRTDRELEEVAIFSVLVAGKNAMTTAKNLERLLAHAGVRLGRRTSPFACLRKYSQEELRFLLRAFGFGCYQLKSRSLYELVRSGLDLRTCTTDDLEQIPGIGPKTSRMFILHTRRGARVAALDVHILHYMADLGHKVPLSTPGSKKRYKALEDTFVRLAEEAGETVADFDLRIWRQYSGHGRDDGRN